MGCHFREKGEPGPEMAAIHRHRMWKRESKDSPGCEKLALEWLFFDHD